MAETRLEMLIRRRDQYIAAEDAILGGAQSYSVGSRQLTRGSLKEVRAAIADLEKEIAAEQSVAAGRGRNCVKRVVPLDY
ncbi:hypothetical protein [Oscillibacter ruminantium]|uniref:hypothetical protein n=1 Tax=Oscillibacter ruminantium TaxID=1263547 RepID=UPI0003165EC0|nr:hypothetical protein [Oscillibacter ruminantium]